MKFFNYLKKLKDQFILWFIIKRNMRIPDLQQTERPKPGVYYYYYGRIVRLAENSMPARMRIKHLSDDELRIMRYRDDSNAEEIKLYNELCEHIFAEPCSQCALHRLGLPCRKVYNYRIIWNNGRRQSVTLQPNEPQDLCFNYHYELIKGKSTDYDITQENKEAVGSAAV